MKHIGDCSHIVARPIHEPALYGMGFDDQKFGADASCSQCCAMVCVFPFDGFPHNGYSHAVPASGRFFSAKKRCAFFHDFNV